MHDLATTLLLSIELINWKAGSKSKILTTMVCDKGGYDYKLTITFHWAIDAWSNGNKSIGPIKVQNGAGCKGLEITSGNDKEHLNINSPEQLTVEPWSHCTFRPSCNECYEPNIRLINVKTGGCKKEKKRWYWGWSQLQELPKLYRICLFWETCDVRSVV